MMGGNVIVKIGSYRQPRGFTNPSLISSVIHSRISRVSERLDSPRRIILTTDREFYALGL